MTGVRPCLFAVKQAALRRELELQYLAACTAETLAEDIRVCWGHHHDL